jgi:hypothetical protein
MAFAPGHLAGHPLPAGIVGALGLSGYQLLTDVAGVGAGRLGAQAFLLVAPDPDPALPEAGTQLSLHHSRLKSDAEAAAFVQLAAQLGFMRLSGYRLGLERAGLRSKVNLIDPGSGAIVGTIPDRHPSRWRGQDVERLLAVVRSLPPAGAPPDLESPEAFRELLLAQALRDEALTGAQAAELADRALALARENRALDPPAALEAARQSSK